MNKIIILGGAGYIGSEIINNKLFVKKKIKIIDRFYFGKPKFKSKNITILKKDIRNLKEDDFKGYDVVFDLAALSNDPSCEIDKNLTYKINYLGRVHAAKTAKKSGIKKYIFFSTCSVYGKNTKKNLDEKSKTMPISEYAKSSLAAEKKILPLSNKRFQVTIFRNATVHGLSLNRMRFDLVVNLMTLHSIKNKKIIILGGGKQTRPFLSIQDIPSYLFKIIKINSYKFAGQIFNIGNENYKIIDIALLVKKLTSNDTEIIFAPDDVDFRDYHVSFSKSQKYFGNISKYKIKDSVLNISKAILNSKISETPKTNTLNWYKSLIENKKILEEILINGKLF